MNLLSTQDHHHGHPTIVEYSHKTVAYSRYDGGLREELTEVDRIVQNELRVLQ